MLDRVGAAPPQRRSVDALPRAEALRAMLESQSRALAAVEAALPALDVAAGMAAGALSRGGALCYAGAGSSGLMALADACELPGTFGLPPERVRIALAGGLPAEGGLDNAAEDDAAAGRAAAMDLRPGDVALVLAASGRTPWALAFARMARGMRAEVVALTCTPRAPLLDLADVPVLLDTGPEVVEGSTRLAAGTAQKVALNLISTQAGILMGHVHDGLMVNLVADNAKLRDRAEAVVTRISGRTAMIAADALQRSDGAVKPAVLAAALGLEPARARACLAETGGHLRPHLEEPRPAHA